MLEEINYCINQKDARKMFLIDGEIPLNNNVTEEVQCNHLKHNGSSKGE